MPQWPEIDAYLKGQGIRVGVPTPGQTDKGNHVPASWHFKGQARDYDTVASNCPAIARALEPFAKGRNPVICELFFSGTRTWYDNGSYFVPGPSQIEYKNHFSHVHAAIYPGRHLPAPEDDVTEQDKEDIANKVLAKLAFGSKAHTNLGDVVNEIVKQVVAALK